MIKFLVLIDTSVDYLAEVEDALQRQQTTYQNNGVNIEYEIRRQDLSSVPWLTNPAIVSYSWIREQTNKLKPNTAYSVVYIFHYENWEAPGIGGWHMGNYNEYQVQLINGVRGNVSWLHKVLMMEGMHSWDTPIREKLGIDLSQYLGVNDYDNNLVHGIYHQGEILSQAESIRIFGEEYTKYDYSLLIKKIAPLLNKIFNTMTWEQIQQLYRVVFHREADEAARGYVGKEPNFVIHELGISGEWSKYDKVYTAVKEIENWARS